MSFGARALIRLGALEQNLETIRATARDSKIMAVIKANAYGHGMVTVARHLSDVDAFAVARVPEAIQLRRSGITAPIVLLAGVINNKEMRDAVEWGFDPVVHCEEQLQLLEAVATGTITVWVKFDTGMHRLGFLPDQAAGVFTRLEQAPVVGEVRVMTHLSSADNLQSGTTRAQLERFQPVIRDFGGAVSIGNTPATFGWPDVSNAKKTLGFRGDNWIRPGIALFGISPFAGRTGEELGLRPVMTVTSNLIAVKTVAADTAVGYGGEWVAERDTRVGIVATGYGDGYTRHAANGTPVWIGDRRAPLIGRVSMDMLAVDLSGVGNARVGDEVILWGGDLPVEDVARHADTIGYELLCQLTRRVEMVEV